jgi:predicted metal-dependent hydrolase
MNKPKTLDIEYRVSSRRKSIGITVTAEGRVVVALPRGASRADLRRALEKHRAWMERRVAASQAALGRLQEGEAYFLGQPFRLKVMQGAAGAVTCHGKEIRVPRPEAAEEVALWPLLQAWYREQALSFLTARVRHWGERMGLAPGQVSLKEWKRRWGECHPDGKLRFNWRLIMCPSGIIDYVVVHELAHLLVPGHNPRFWAQVAKVMPDYAARRRWLNRDGAPFLLWQPEITPGLSPPP